MMLIRRIALTQRRCFHSSSTTLTRHVRITLFTRDNCSLCADAAAVLANVHKTTWFSLDTINVMKTEHSRWRVYEYDVPVIHVENVEPDQRTVLNSKKLMHRFKEEQVQELLEQVTSDDESTESK